MFAQHHGNNIAVTDINADACANCNTVVHDNICGTKCNDNNWSYNSNGAEYVTLVVTLLLLWSFPGNGAKYDFK